MRAHGRSSGRKAKSKLNFLNIGGHGHSKSCTGRPLLFRQLVSFCKVLVTTVLILGALFALLLCSHLYRKNSLPYAPEDVSYSFVHKARVELEDDQLPKEASSGGPQDKVQRLRYMHMGMLSILPNGSLGAFFQSSESKFEGVLDQSIFWSVSEDEGETWNEPRILVHSNNKLPIWSPVVHCQGDRIHVFFSKSSKYCEYFDKSKGVLRHSPGGDILYTMSNNDGETWTFPQKVLAYQEPKPKSLPGAGVAEGMSSDTDWKSFGVPKVIANRLTVLSNGAWLLPYWREPGKTCPVVRSTTPTSQWVNGSAGVLYSENEGLTWEIKGKDLADKNTWLIENSIAEVGRSNVLLQVFRTKTGQAYKDYSYDMGLTWTKPVRMFLPNPNSKMCILELPNGNILAAYNHSPTKRTPLSLALSKDGGVFWTILAHLEDDPELQYAYPTMLLSGDDLLVIYSVMSKQSGTLLSIGMKVAKLKVNKLLTI